MKKVIYLLILFLLLPLSISAQAPGGHITRKKTSTTTSAPKKSTATPKKTTPAAKSHSSRKPHSGGQTSQSSGTAAAGSREELAPVGMSQVQMDPIIQNLINNMVYVQGGTFMMGATSEQGGNAAADEKPAHQVTLSSFSIGRYEVTQEEWQAVMGSNPSHFKGDKRPVENVSWYDCQAFIRKLNSISGRQFRLPTEAEWEYAARGGNRSRGYKYAGNNNPNTVAWYLDYDNSENQTHERGGKQPNELGLYDMSGNVWEWCQDYYGSYSSSSQTNPIGPSSGSPRVLRGGGWNYFELGCRVSYRRNDYPTGRGGDNGLRLALTESMYADSPETSQVSNERNVSSQVSQGKLTNQNQSSLVQVISVNGVSFKMMKVSGGTFQMGSDIYDERPVHSFTLSDYYIGETEVTQALWTAVMGEKKLGWIRSYGKGRSYPAYDIDWEDYWEFLNKLNDLTGMSFRLPTEAEWEFAARGGNASEGYKYSGSDDINAVAWYSNIDGESTRAVAMKSPNELGLYDMSGNVWEWCQDWYDAYSPSAQVNPTGPSSGTFRVQRGGSLGYIDSCCSISYRGHCMPDVGRECQGLRLAYKFISPINLNC